MTGIISIFTAPFIMMAVLANIVIEQDIRLRLRHQQMIKKRVLRDESDPFRVCPEVFKIHYRMYQPMAINLINRLEPHLPNHPRGVPPYLQVLCTLRFLAKGPYQKGIGENFNCPMSQSSISRYLHNVIPAINQLAPELIRFPRTPQEKVAVSRRFQQVMGVPNILGAVDCTLPQIHAPAHHGNAYLNYKRDHSLCVQVIADMVLNILDVRICCGSTNDRFVWHYSDARLYMYRLRINYEDRMRQQRQNLLRGLEHPEVPIEGPYYIIGDGGYSPSRVLLTPIQRAIPGTPEYAYSHALRRARVRVENVFGVVKQVWRCLNKERGLHYDPIFASQIVLACCALHNFILREGLPLNLEQPDINEEVRDLNNYQNINYDVRAEYLLGLQEREAVINTWFN